MIRVGIAGAAGYTGGELLRILLRHPQVEIVFAHSKSQAGKPVSFIHQDLEAETELSFAAEWNSNIDVLFLCVGHGEAIKLLSEVSFPADLRIIDLSQDFRLKDKATFGERRFIYGLPEKNREQIIHAQNIANPGCFATALQLALLPLVANDWMGDVYATGVTGSTGAGQGMSATSHFSWRSNNIQAYKSLTHQHLLEVGESLAMANPANTAPSLHFVPWRGDFARGIFISQQVKTDLTLAQLTELYQAYYSLHPFTSLCTGNLHLKQVVNTNKCMIQIEQHEGQTVIHSAIDNLLKGASGQAVQNMNLMFQLPEMTGLDLKASYF